MRRNLYFESLILLLALAAPLRAGEILLAIPDVTLPRNAPIAPSREMSIANFAGLTVPLAPAPEMPLIASPGSVDFQNVLQAVSEKPLDARRPAPVFDALRNFSAADFDRLARHQARVAYSIPRFAGVPSGLPESTSKLLKKLKQEPGGIFKINGIINDVEKHASGLNSRQRPALAKKLTTTLPQKIAGRRNPLVELIYALARKNPAARPAVAETMFHKLDDFESSLESYAVGRRVVSAAIADPRARTLVLKGLMDHLAPIAGKNRDLDLIRTLPYASEEQARSIAMLLEIKAAGDPQQPQRIWAELVRTVIEKPAKNRSRPKKPLLQLWFKPDAFRERMPTLVDVLSDAGKTGRFLSALSLLRLQCPYYLANDSALPPVAWGKERGIRFKFHELWIYPVSESFRRFIIEDETGSLAVEIKIPGQDEKYHPNVEPTSFNVAQELWTRFPDDPGVVAPIYYGQYAGRVRLYGKERAFDRKTPFGVAVFAYQDGKRLSNASRMIESLAKSSGKDPESIQRRLLPGPAAAAIRLHQLGWQGETDGNDMHPENVRVLTDGKAVLVADFDAFKRQEGLSMDQRSKETAGLAGTFLTSRDPDQEDPFELRELTPATARAIYPKVFRLLSRKIRSPEDRERLRHQIRQELRLEKP